MGISDHCAITRGKSDGLLWNLLKLHFQFKFFYQGLMTVVSCVYDVGLL